MFTRMVEVGRSCTRKRDLILIENTFQQPQLIDPFVFHDHRGSIFRMRPASGQDANAEQIAITSNHQAGVFRGFHVNKKCAEIKTVMCTEGAVWDHCLDLREGSPTFLHCFSFRLSSDDRKLLVIPGGFGHGIESITMFSTFIYFSNQCADPDSEFVVHPNDPSIRWDAPRQADLLLSVKDSSASYLDSNFRGFSCQF